jgi:hypothetical protein
MHAGACRSPIPEDTAWTLPATRSSQAHQGGACSGRPSHSCHPCRWTAVVVTHKAGAATHVRAGVMVGWCPCGVGRRANYPSCDTPRRKQASAGLAPSASALQDRMLKAIHHKARRARGAPLRARAAAHAFEARSRTGQRRGRGAPRPCCMQGSCCSAVRGCRRCPGRSPGNLRAGPADGSGRIRGMVMPDQGRAGAGGAGRPGVHHPPLA